MIPATIFVLSLCTIVNSWCLIVAVRRVSALDAEVRELRVRVAPLAPVTMRGVRVVRVSRPVRAGEMLTAADCEVEWGP